MKKVFALVAIHVASFMMAITFPACNPCNEGPYTFSAKDIELSAKRITEIDFSHSLHGEYKVADLQLTEPVRYDSFGVDISHDLEMIAWEMRGSPFMTTNALACDPYVGYDYVEEINIVSSEDYLPSYPAGTDLNSIMSIRRGYDVPGMNFTFLYFELTEMNFFLTFEVPPMQQASHDFSIVYKLRGGRTISKTISGVILKP